MKLTVALSALAILSLGTQDARAQDHGTAASVGIASVAEAAAFHMEYFSRVRTYTLSDGRSLMIAPFQGIAGAADTISVFDPAACRMIGLASTALDTLAGQSDTFVLKDHGARIEWRRGNEPIVTGLSDPDLAFEDIRFGSGEISGRLTATPGNDRRPVVILSPGSGPAGHNFTYFPLLAAHLARNGFRVFTYEKQSSRPAGEPYSDRLVPQLAEDIQAAVTALRARPDVDPDKVGLVGISQAGWSAPVAAVQGGGIAFMTLVSAPSISSWEQEIDSLKSNMSGPGFTDAQRLDALRAIELMFASARSGTVSPELVEAVARIRNEPWFSRTDISDRPQDLAAWTRGYFDPKPTLERLNLPLFLAFGGADMITPYAPYIPVWRERLAVAGATDVTIKVYPGYGHGLVNPTGADRLVAPLFLPALTMWLRDRAGLEAAAPDVSDPGALSQADAMLQTERLAGNYILPDRNVVTVIPMNRALVLNDLGSGRMGVLQPQPESSTRFHLLSPDGRAKATPETVSFGVDGGRSFLILNESGQPPRRAMRPEASEEEVSYRTTDGLDQYGILVKPTGAGPHPVVVFQAGSGPSTRQNFLNWAHMFAANGVAALSLDKRGYGKSPGDGPGATLGVNASDASAAVDYLMTRSDIRHDRIGLIGTSRGGWTAPMAAARNANIAFIVVSSGGPTSTADQERYARLKRVEDAGFSGEALAQAAQVLDAYFPFLASDRSVGAAEVSENWRRYGEQPWYNLLRLRSGDPAVGDLSPVLRVFSDDLRLDTVALYSSLRQPVLFMEGDRDELFPTAANIALIQRLAARRPDWTVQLFPGANHNFLLPAEPGDVGRTAPGYYDAMVRWVLQQARRE